MAAATAPTSLRTPTTDTENAYTQLQAELAKPAPRQYEIFIIVLQRMTAAQRQRLLRPGNVEWEKITPAGRDFYNRGNGWHVTVAGDIAYFATDEIMVIDVSDKMNPVPLSTYVTPDEARHSTLANDRLYVSDCRQQRFDQLRNGGPRPYPVLSNRPAPAASLTRWLSSPSTAQHWQLFAVQCNMNACRVSAHRGVCDARGHGVFHHRRV